MSSQHANKVIAEGGVCTVEYCGECDVVHIHFGHASVRMKPEAFMAACQTLFTGMHRLMPQEFDAAAARKAIGPSSCH